MSPLDPNARMPQWLEQAWLARLLARELTPAENEWFEAYVLDKPELLAEIERDNDLRDALAGAAIETTATDGAIPPSSAPNDRDDTIAHLTPRAPSRSTMSSRPWGFSLAASLVAGLGIGWLMHATPGAPDAIGSPTRLVFDTLRGGATAPLIENDQAASLYVLIEAAVPPEATAIELRVGTQAPLSLTPSAEGFVSALVRRDALRGIDSAQLHYRLGEEARDQTLSLSALRAR